MKVQEVLLENNMKRYMLLDDKGLLVLPVMKYIKYLDTRGKSPNTQKTYCYALKEYFTFLEDVNLGYKDVRLEDLVDFIAWLRNPYGINKAVPLQPTEARKKENTINLILTAVNGFYDYLYRNEELDKAMVDLVTKEQLFKGAKRAYRDFLYHVNQNSPSHKNVLRVKKRKVKLKVLSKMEVEMLYNGATNIRDKLLIQTLYETGLRIGELLSLFIEDFIFDHKGGHRIKLVDRGELENGAKLKTSEREIYVSQSLMDLLDDYLYEVIDDLDIDTNFVFVKLKGKNIGHPMNYQNVSALFKRLRKKVKFKVHPHLLRHTHATMYYRQTGDIKQVQERIGHSQIQTTINFYLHPSEEDIRNNWEKAQSAFQIGSKEYSNGE
ncbi:MULTISPECIES: tyrosine-type recombinase/integrase [Bacillaceae]|nr:MULTISPECIES: tyrosine-type recombinase/integrase [Bacillaceae]MEC2074314.1 tyrosine-type recombinase/integrase [Alkalihalophilus marmarensis]